MSTYFTHAEAKSKLGKTIISKVPFYQILKGSSGTVTGIYKMGNLYGLDIKWDGIDITDGFSKDDYEEFLEEMNDTSY